MATQLTSTQKADLEVQGFDAAGNPAPLENVGWAESDKAIIRVEGKGDTKATVFAVGPVGTAQVQVRADTKIGEAVNEVTGVLDIEIVAGEAAIIKVTAGEAQEQ